MNREQLAHVLRAASGVVDDPESFGFYAQGVSVRTAVLPNGWRDRVIHWSNNSTGRAHAAFLEPHDCVVSKLVASREKDRAFAQALLQARLIDITTLRSRVDTLPAEVDPRVTRQLHSWLDVQKQQQKPQ